MVTRMSSSCTAAVAFSWDTKSASIPAFSFAQLRSNKKSSNFTAENVVYDKANVLILKKRFCAFVCQQCRAVTYEYCAYKKPTRKHKIS